MKTKIFAALLVFLAACGDETYTPVLDDGVYEIVGGCAAGPCEPYWYGDTEWSLEHTGGRRYELWEIGELTDVGGELSGSWLYRHGWCDNNQAVLTITPTRNDAFVGTIDIKEVVEGSYKCHQDGSTMDCVCSEATVAVYQVEFNGRWLKATW